MANPRSANENRSEIGLLVLLEHLPAAQVQGRIKRAVRRRDGGASSRLATAEKNHAARAGILRSAIQPVKTKDSADSLPRDHAVAAARGVSLGSERAFSTLHWWKRRFC